MDNKILLKVLQLDSLLHRLTWYDRARVHQFMAGSAEKVSQSVYKIYLWIKKTDWQPPNVRYGQDRLLYYENNLGEWRPVEELEETIKELPI